MSQVGISATTKSTVPRKAPLNAVPSWDSWKFFTPLALAASYQWILCFGTNFGLPVSRAIIGAAEAVVLLIMLAVGKFALSAKYMGLCLALMTYMASLWVMRGGEIDLKPVRDLMIPIIAFWYGTKMHLNRKALDTGLLTLAIAIAFIGALEFTELYASLFNTFNYYAAAGVIDPTNAMMEGQTVTLNSLRPEGIGRTLFPELLGQQRISSTFLEPISMGNFGVIVAAWGLAKPFREWKYSLYFLIAAAVLITMADSRFGIATVCLMIIFRLALTEKVATAAAFTLPFVAAVGTVLISVWTNEAGDNFAGRLAYSGKRLLALDALSLMGLSEFNRPLFDTGYAYALTRFGLALLLSLWIILFLIPKTSLTASRFRTNIALYISLILCISGTSVFALKTSVILWAMVGSSFALLNGRDKSMTNPLTEAH